MRKTTFLLLAILLHLSVLKAQTIAFPGAEGFGKYTEGGRGGKIYVVSNLNDEGEGSLREAVEAKHPRIVVFSVSGTIHLKSPLRIAKNVTIAGQSAPGDGICIADYPVTLIGDNIIMRYLRIRMGDRYQNKGKIDKAGADDALSGGRRKNIIIDHCSLSWSTDELMSIYAGDSTTFQWNLLAEPLNYSYHFEAGDTDFQNHGYGGIWGGKALTAHHNLFAHCLSRVPRFNGARLGATEEFVDFRNNVIYNWGHNNIYGGEGGKYNIVSNYYKPGPNTSKSVKGRLVNPTTPNDNNSYGQFFVNGNIIEGDIVVSKDNNFGIHLDKKAAPNDRTLAVSYKPFDAEIMPEITAEKSFAKVLEYVGASYKRDAVDKRIISEVKNGTGKIIDVQGGYPHGTAYEKTISAWPLLIQQIAPKDTDNDGMPDEWELKNKLNPNDASDASSFSTKNNKYTNIEIYLNNLIDEKVYKP